MCVPRDDPSRSGSAVVVSIVATIGSSIIHYRAPKQPKNVFFAELFLFNKSINYSHNTICVVVNYQLSLQHYRLFAYILVM